MVQTINACGTDVHCRPLSNCFQTLKNLDMLGAVIRFRCRELLRFAPRILDLFSHLFLPPDSSDADVTLLSVFVGKLGEKRTLPPDRKIRDILTKKPGFRQESFEKH